MTEPGADPLEAAIEAARRKVRELEAMTRDEYLEQRIEIDAAIRAAAPHIERAAILRAADEVEAILPTVVHGDPYEVGYRDGLRKAARSVRAAAVQTGDTSES